MLLVLQFSYLTGKLKTSSKLRDLGWRGGVVGVRVCKFYNERELSIICVVLRFKNIVRQGY